MRRVFSHDGLDVAVDASAADLEWLEEFLAPSFVAADEGSARVRVSYDVLPPDVGVDSSAATGRVAFALDSGPVRFLERTVNDRVDLRGPDGTLMFQVHDGGRRASVLHGARPILTRVRLMRVVREYTHNHAIGTGGVMLHAAAVTVDGRAVAIAGAKGAGKTTLALKALVAPGVEYLSNDRVLVRSAQPGFDAIAVPTVIAVRPGTRRLLPQLAAALEQGGDFRESARERHARGPAPPDITGDTWRSSAEQVIGCLGRSRVAAAPLAFVFFPSRTPLRDGPFRLMARDEAADALANALVGHPLGYTSQVFVLDPETTPHETVIRDRARALAATVPCIAGHLPDATSAAEMADWLGERSLQFR